MNILPYVYIEFWVFLDCLRGKKWPISDPDLPKLHLKRGILPTLSVAACDMGLTKCKIDQNEGLFGAADLK